MPPADEGLWDVFVKDIPRSATSCTVSLDRLRPGVTYEFRVLAVNQVGYGEPSSPSTAVSGRGPPGKRLVAGEGQWHAATVGREGQRRAACSLASKACAPTGNDRRMMAQPRGLNTGLWAQSAVAS